MMKKSFKILLMVLLAIIVIHSIVVTALYFHNAHRAKHSIASANIRPRFNWDSIPPKAKVDILSALIFDEVSFNDQTLGECLTQLSDRTRDLLGHGVSYSIRGPEGSRSLPDQHISLKFKEITFLEILKYLGAASGAKIEMTEYGIIATYGNAQSQTP
jgi:hypothetical protein